MSAGTGITHSEWNASEAEPVHFLQMWVPPDVTGVPAGYQETDVTEALAGGHLVLIAGSTSDAGALHTSTRPAPSRIARARAPRAPCPPAHARTCSFTARQCPRTEQR